MPKNKALCACGHKPGDHIKYKRDCRGMDELGISCECPEYTEAEQ